MNTKRTFTPQEKYAVYTVHGMRCYLCRKPIDLKNMQVDHIIPEAYINDLDGYNKIKKEYGLDDNFDINSFQNWLPSCAGCNNTKSDKVFKPVPKILIELDRAKSKAEKAEKLSKKIHSKQMLTRSINIIKSAPSADFDFNDEVKNNAIDNFLFDDEEMFYDVLSSLSSRDKAYFTDQVVQELFNKLDRLIESNFSRISKYLWLFLYYEHKKRYSAERKYEDREEFLLESVLEYEKPLSRGDKKLLSQIVLQTEESEYLIL